MVKNEKEFERNVCFTFFESYLEGAEKMAVVQGKEFAFDYLTAIIRYALYEEESDDPVINAIVSALKNTIDANQSKRATGFSGENMEQTEAILKYYEEHPNASEREVADAVKCSKTKVNKVKKKYSIPVSSNREASNSSVNPNGNINPNSNSNYSSNLNRMTVGDANESSAEAADAEEKNEVP